MKILISLALLLTIGSISAQNLISGTWYNSYTSNDYSSYCCVPTSMDIYCSGSSSCTATYKYPGTVGSKCWRLFMSSSGSGSLKLTSKTYSSSDYYLSESTWGNIRFNFQASNYTGTPTLTVTSDSSYSSDGCSFIMQSRNAPASGGIGSLIFFIIIFFIIVASASAKQYQKRQAYVIAQNLTHQQPIAVVPGFNFNTPPTVVQVPQPQFVQPQVTYTAPNQFPNAQVNMNYGNNVQFPNAQVNMNFNGNNGGFQGNNGGFHVQGNY